ncbi:MAG TPA: ABC transporter substrate-binding protein [Dehalococcoidia bacterium]|nr:ABC transporter substrate-binding protein [Dehalococcoidia bacterium]
MDGNYWQQALARRTSRRRAIVATGAVTASAAFLAACGGSDSGGDGGEGKQKASGLLATPSDTSKQAKRGGILRRNVNAEAPSLDPHQNFAPVVPFYETVVGRLLGFKPGIMGNASEEVDGDLAESWELSPDKTQITFKLRPNTKWHPVAPVNGRAVDVDDFMFTWERFSTVGSQRGGLVNSVNPNAPIVSMTAPDSRTIVAKLKEPLVYALALFGARENLNIVPKEAKDTGALDLRSKMIGTGPYYMADYQRSVAITLKRHPEFYDKTSSFVDEIHYPIVTEYAQMAAQLRAGNLYVPLTGTGIRLEDVVGIKREVPDIGLYSSQRFSAGNRLIFGWKTPQLLDERVRQAMSMAYDRDLWIDVWNNAPAFEKEGLPIERTWFSSINSVHEAYDGWRLDPRDAKTFGPNAKYFQHNVAEAKKLLSAAGFPNGFEVTATGPKGNDYGINFGREQEVRQGMQAEIGIKFQNNPIDYQTEFIPKYRDVNGKFEGIAYRSGPPPTSSDAVGTLTFWYYSKAGTSFLGFDAANKGDGSGDPKLDADIKKAQQEFDVAKRKAITQDIDRYLAEKMYVLQGLGGANGFSLAWATVQNFEAYRGAIQNANRVHNMNWWLDDTKAPLKKA